MRLSILLLATAVLTSCSQQEESEPPAATAVPAQLSFEGADYKNDTAKLLHGERLSWVLGCKGCHGSNLQGGNVTKDDPDFGDMNAPNLTLLMAGYSDTELERLIRHGQPKDRREFWFMPVESYQFLSDADQAALVAHLRTFKPAGKQQPPIRIGPGLRKQTADGILLNSEGMLKRYRDEAPPETGQQHAYGRRLSQIICAECHNSSLQGFEGFTPDLDIAGVYNSAELEALLTTGKGKSKPDLGLMSASAKDRFAKLTPKERAAIIAYVKARADRPQPAQ